MKVSDKYPLRSEGRDYVVLAGSFVPAGAGVTAPTGVRGKGFTVTQTADGVFAVAFTNPYMECVSFVCTARVAAETTDIYAQHGDITAATATAGEVHGIRTMTAGTPTSIHADADARVDFVAVFRNSSLT